MQALTSDFIYACCDVWEKCLHDLFVEGIIRRDIRRDGSRGAGGSGLPNGAGGSSLANGNSCRLVSATYKVGFRRASVREGPT
jgi:hypothetical protein